jgi:glucose-6-phosphate 1-epimerase
VGRSGPSWITAERALIIADVSRDAQRVAGWEAGPVTDIAPDTRVDGDDPCRPLTLGLGPQSRLTVLPHGGQVLGWTPAGAAADRLWLSPEYVCGPGKAVRGGIPVIFPQFSDRGPLPKHGVARDRAWQCTRAGSGQDVSHASMELVDDEATRAVWPYRFRLALEVLAHPAALDVTLSVRNDDDRGFDFTAALHSYLAVGDAGARIHGLEGRPAEDNAAGRAAVTTPAEPLTALEKRDVAVRGATAPVVLDDPALGPLTVTATGFTDVVVWNPGPGHGLGDVPDGAERGFVCIEPAALTPVPLAPGAEWHGSLRIAV